MTQPKPHPAPERPLRRATGYCHWPRCTRLTREIPAPLCFVHLAEAYQIFRTTCLPVLQDRIDAAFDEPVQVDPPRKPKRQFAPVRETPGLVYFVSLGDRIKIGFTTNLERRMQAVPHDEILGTVIGTMEDEARCHKAFDHLRMTGEWFRAEPDLLQFIADVASPPDRLPDRPS